ncbi:hypothetical protein TSOC_012217 [Tetrabaena socialis]|uniref:Uncharacterized protein n=1 Tax=Tetrabaena socialis TaxID=47790 RepID=A0A2J7ZNM2_9CHLO|nr:hypothetical protein TSOC_012217 [Tetrabaena socialis]|eukprot:PNH01850.1 hypothetical protein TSOC_012217 [Tetrabaena socialis]
MRAGEGSREGGNVGRGTQGSLPHSTHMMNRSFRHVDQAGVYTFVAGEMVELCDMHKGNMLVKYTRASLDENRRPISVARKAWLPEAVLTKLSNADSQDDPPPPSSQDHLYKQEHRIKCEPGLKRGSVRERGSCIEIDMEEKEEGEGEKETDVIDLASEDTG